MSTDSDPNEPGCVDCGRPLHPHGNALRECRNPDCAMYARGLAYRCKCEDSPAAPIGFQCSICGTSAQNTAGVKPR